MEAAQALQVKELAYRKSDGLEVTLWWVKGTIDTYVSVVDHKTQPPTHHNVAVESPASANDVFNHPFRYIPDNPTIELEPIDGRGDQ